MAVTGRQPKVIVDASMFTHIDIFFTLKEKGRPDSLVRGVVRGVVHLVRVNVFNSTGRICKNKF